MGRGVGITVLFLVFGGGRETIRHRKEPAVIGFGSPFGAPSATRQTTTAKREARVESNVTVTKNC